VSTFFVYRDGEELVGSSPTLTAVLLRKQACMSTKLSRRFLVSFSSKHGHWEHHLVGSTSPSRGYIYGLLFHDSVTQDSNMCILTFDVYEQFSFLDTTFFKFMSDRAIANGGFT